MLPGLPEPVLNLARRVGQGVGLSPVSAPAGDDRCAIIDIGSNSIRLVVYHGRTRMPETMFNEKVMAGLGRGIAANGRLSDNAMDVAVAGLRRFAALVRAMGVANVRTVATAAVREAKNGQAFINRVAAECGLVIEVIDGEAEARWGRSSRRRSTRLSGRAKARASPFTWWVDRGGRWRKSTSG